ncbi:MULTISPECIES: GSU2403 family nucleotidyltransferase fold protein [unclassified Mesorhizobium]|uniref:GSU2403 family nucleotidyltransferase fold protein n=1 Tax=unclassified Mesorhizobium TaxID=325217 RepID=UPI000465B362|nr:MULTISPECIES: GSU2403 family nucleotidyltransferase fold protein [unclassified Mesorhizobium]
MTEDIDLLTDARRSLTIKAGTNLEDGALINILRKVDRSFKRPSATFRAVNRDGYLVDPIKTAGEPGLEEEPKGKGDELVAAEIVGLAWLENAFAFEAIAIDEKGDVLRLVCSRPSGFCGLQILALETS